MPIIIKITINNNTFEYIHLISDIINTSITAKTSLSQTVLIVLFFENVLKMLIDIMNNKYTC